MRRCALSALSAWALLLAVGARAETFTQRIDELRITQGPLAGAYRESAGGAGLRWYFATIGVQDIARDGHHDAQVRAYLECYLAHIRPDTQALDDYQDVSGLQPVRKTADSDDSYCATLLSLASGYAARPGGAAWVRSHLPALKRYARANLLSVISPKLDLTYTFNHEPGRTAALGKAVPYQQVCQLMDNCEVYRGLQDFADYLVSEKDPDAPAYATAAKWIAGGIARMFDPTTKTFRVNDTEAHGPSGKNVRFYPYRFIQVAPQVFGVDLGANTQAMYDGAWSYVNSAGDEWWVGKITSSPPDGAPFMILGYCAALRGDRVKAAQQVKWYEELLQKTDHAALCNYIHEFGFALQTRQILDR